VSQLSVNTITNAAGGNTAQINGMTPTADSLQGFRNRLINSDMRIDQRNAGASVTQGTSATYVTDRFSIRGSVTSKFTGQQSSTAPAGFVNSLLCTSSSAYSVGAAEAFFLAQVIEGNNVADFGWGTANAATVTLSFWVRSSLTGTFGGAISNYAGDRSYPFTYTISSANTFEQKSVTIAGDTSGTWVTNNGGSVAVQFGLGAGATLSGTAGAWAAALYRSATGAVSVVGTSGATFYITGVQLEAGSVATPFERRPYGTELALCQRYFTLCQLGISSGIVGFVDSSTSFIGYFYLPVEMRSLPTLTTSGTAADYLIRYTGGNTITCNAVPTINNPSTNIARVQATVASGLTGGQAAALASAAGSKTLGFNSEL
jgi:hypothetical protein